ncbi:MAG TPA: capsular polysaccharide synthesis protein [bacterium]|nr:capsular polysaccharide synthesis protein [bacterium]
MSPLPIFTFWEPRERMPAYIRLCIRTWEKHLPDHPLILTDHSNIETYIGKDAFDLETLKKLGLAAQKDAFMVAILQRQGGIFMDADTLIGGDISWFLEHLKESEIVLFGLHMGFMAARPGAKILTICEEGIRGRLEELRRGPAPFKNEWDYVGNSVLTDAMIELSLTLPFCRAFDRLWRSRRAYHSASKSFWQKVANQRRWLVKLKPYRRYFKSLPPKEHGFIAENRHFGRRYDSVQKFRRFWLDPKLEVPDLFRPGANIIGLHNSRMPEWYRALSEEEVLRQGGLLSRTFSNFFSS